jgi:hypothetical protein
MNRIPAGVEQSSSCRGSGALQASGNHQTGGRHALLEFAEDELRAMLNGVVGANLIRRQRLSVLADRANGIGSQLARDPEHSALVPRVEKVKRLKKLERLKKAMPASPGADSRDDRTDDRVPGFTAAHVDVT